MNKLFLVVSLFLLGSFAQAQSFFKEYKTNVLEANEKQIVIADSPEFIVGASGVVTHKFDAKSTTIIARVDVISKDGTKAVLRLEKFEMLSQGAFPDTGIKPLILTGTFPRLTQRRRRVVGADREPARRHLALCRGQSVQRRPDAPCRHGPGPHPAARGRDGTGRLDAGPRPQA